MIEYKIAVNLRLLNIVSEFFWGCLFCGCGARPKPFIVNEQIMGFGVVDAEVGLDRAAAKWTFHRPQMGGGGLKDVKRLAAVLAIIIVLLLAAGNLLLRSPSVSHVSAVQVTVPIGVYWDANGNSRVESIDWGTTAPGAEKKIPIYVRNEGNEAFVLSLAAANWQGDNTSDCMTFSCGTPKIIPGEAVQVVLTLLIFANVSGINSYSFDIVLGQTLTAIADFDSLFSNNPNVRMIYPSDSPNKPLNCGAAMTSDWTASAFVSTKLTNFTEGFDTEPSFVNQTTGRPLGTSGTGIISFGGPFVNPVVKYAESDSTLQSDRAPIRFHNESGVFYFQHWNGSNIPGASMPVSAVNGNQDIFVIETFSDASGRYTMLCYGFGWKGTYAAGKYFDRVIYPNLASQLESWIIVKWEDTNGNGFVNGPNDGDVYTVIAKGN